MPLAGVEGDGGGVLVFFGTSEDLAAFGGFVVFGFVFCFCVFVFVCFVCFFGVFFLFVVFFVFFFVF